MAISSGGLALCGVSPKYPKKRRWWVSSTGEMTNTEPARGMDRPIGMIVTSGIRCSVIRT